MGGGLMQLVAYGAQDVYLTGNPQITFFKVVYRRHTNFSFETVEHTIDSCRPGGNYTVTIHKNGDLITNGGLKIVLPPVDAAASISSGGWEMNVGDKVAWCRRLGHAVIKHVEIEIGGSKIDKQLGIWMDIWFELTCPASKERGYRACIGDIDMLTSLKTIKNIDEDDIEPYTLYIPFQFWWCRNVGLSIPLIALQYHEVLINIQLEEADKLLVWSGTIPNLNSWTFESASIFLDYIYLDTDERRRFAKIGHEYLIEQIQFAGNEIINGNVSTTNQIINEKFKLNFNHPCKEIIWATRLGVFTGKNNERFSLDNNKFISYSHQDDWLEAIKTAAKGLVESCIGSVSNEIPKPPNTTLIPFTATQNPVQATVGKNNNNLSIQVIGNYDSTSCKLYTINDNILVKNNIDLIDYIIDSDINITLSTDKTRVEKIECVSVRHKININDISIPINHYTDGRDQTINSTTSMTDSRANVDDIYIVQSNNYGLRLDRKGNILSSATLELNGHERATEQDGTYYNYWQTRIHTRTPSDGVNVYSFALQPETHQPSGTANLSRIETAILNMNFSDNIRSYALDCPILDWVFGTNVHIFAINYNIFRVMSGMGGIAYSN